MKKVLLGAIVATLISGCSYSAQLMSRDTGKIYKGEIQSNGNGTGTMTAYIDDRTCTGKFVKAASGDSFGLVQSFGAKGFSTSTVQSSGSGQYKALLTCNDGTGLRCDVSGEQSGGGVCADNKNRIYDMIYSR